MNGDVRIATAKSLRRLMAAIRIECDIYRIFVCDPITGPPADPRLRIEPNATSSDHEAWGTYAARLMIDGQAVSRCSIWSWDSRHAAKRGYFPLRPGEGELGLLETPPALRGRGYAAELMRAVREGGAPVHMTRLFSRIWHSNRSSVRALIKAGWKQRGLRIDLRWGQRHCHFMLPVR